MRRPSALRLSLLLVLGALAACAEENAPPVEVIRRGDEPDARVVDAEPDAAPPPDAAAPPDAEPAPDAGPPPVPPERAVWVVVHAAPWADGLRAALQPPQAPLWTDPRRVLSTLPAAVAVVRWHRPQSPATALLDGLLDDAGRPVTVLYDLRARAADTEALRPAAESDARWLAARLLGSPTTAQFEGRPALAVSFDAADPDQVEAWQAARRRVAEVADVRWLVEVDTATPVAPPAGAAALFPRTAYGASPGGAADEQPADVAARRAWRAAGLPWIPRAAPPPNPRLDVPDAVVQPPLGGRRLHRSLVLARRDAGDLIWVDGVGAWRDDRQLDPVEGEETDDPFHLTSGVSYPPYGSARLERVQRALLAPAGAPPSDPGQGGPLLPIVERGAAAAVEQVPGGLRVDLHDTDGTGRAEVLLDDRPFIVPDMLVLRYRRTSPHLYVDLVFAGGARLHEVLPPPRAGAEAVEISLRPFAGLRVEEVTLVYAGGARRITATVEHLTLAPR